MKLLLLLAFLSRAQAAVIVGTNYNGANLAPSNGDILSGTFTAVGQFFIPAGNTAFVATGVNLVIYASTVTISGTLDGSGRGAQGGAGGTFVTGGTGNAGQAGFDGSGNLSASGQGLGGAGGNNTTPTNASGGGGGAGGGSGGAGGGPTPGAAGPGYGSASTNGSFLSSSDSLQGSGGGGGGANSNSNGGNGGAGGGAVYIEAGSMTVTGSIIVSGSTAPAAVNGNAGVQPAGGGGGGGGTLLLRVPGTLDISAALTLAADGGHGGNVDSRNGGVLEPGGGGGGGRVKLFASQTSYGTVVLSTAAGPAGFRDGGFGGNPDATALPGLGSSGTIAFGIIASSPTQFGVQAVHATSIDWSWTPLAGGLIGNGANSAYHVFPASASIFANAASAPLPPPQASVAGAASGGVTETGLVPNTTYYRFVTAFTTWGDSLPSAVVSTHTLCVAPAPAAAAFTGMADTTLTVNWTAGANSTSTVYEIHASTAQNFGVPTSTSLAMFAQGVSPSSAPVNLIPNTTYFFQVRAGNIDGVPTAYTTTMTTATLASVPASAAVGGVYVTSAALSWSGGRNPAGTVYTAQISTDNFFSINTSSRTLMTSATFFSLTPGTQYFFRAFATNVESLPSNFSTVVSTTLGILSDTSPPGAPGVPSPDRQFSYDGTINFSWAPGTSGVGILDYNLIVGSLPGASDFFNGNVSVTTFSAVGLTTGHTYYAQVRARSNAGVYGAFSGVSNGVSIFITSQVSPVTKPINWPNPFNPASGPTQIGFFIDSPGSVVLKIFTLQGQLVHQASQGFGAAGNQIMAWDGNSDSGGRVAPGGYVALIEKHLSSGTTSQKLKIAILY